MSRSAVVDGRVRRGRSGEDARIVFWLLTPAALVVFVLLVLPLLLMLYLSLTTAQGEITLAHYALLGNNSNRVAFLQTFQVAFLVTFFCALIGYPIAYTFSRLPQRTANLLMIAVLLPYWTSVLVRTYAWLVLLQRRGVVNTLLLETGVTETPVQMVYNMLGTVIGMVHVLLPFMILPLYSSMRMLGDQYHNAAASCGATPTQAFRDVFFPLTVPALAAGCVLVFVQALGYYVIPAILGGGRVHMWAVQIDNAMNTYPSWGPAAALGITLLVTTTLILAVFGRLVDRGGTREH